MTSNFDKHGPSEQRKAVSQSSASQSAPAAALDNLKRDRFELLSAYLDGEVTIHERRQVEHWLKTDQNIRCLYSRLIKLREGMRTMAVPTSERSVEQTLESVYKKVDRGPKVVIAWVGAALALLAVPFFADDLRLEFINAVPEKAEMAEPTTPTANEPFRSDLQLPLNKAVVGHGAAGIPMVEQEEISKDNLMLQLDKSVFPIPEVDK